MKHKIIVAIVILISFYGFSQKKDVKEIIDLVILDYRKDTIQVYKKFNNYHLSEGYSRTHWIKEAEIFKKYQDFDSLYAHAFCDTVTFKFNGLKVYKNFTEEIIQKTDYKKINKYTKYKLTRKTDKYAYISYPIISTDNNKAFVYVGYYCGRLCGGGGILHLEKKNGSWQILKYEPTWVA